MNYFFSRFRIFENLAKTCQRRSRIWFLSIFPIGKNPDVRARVARPSPGMAATGPRAAAMCRFLVSKRAESLGLEPLPRLGVPREEGKVVVYVVYMS